MSSRFVIALCICSALVLGAGEPVMAQSAADLQNQINTHNAQIKALNEEIAKYQKELNALAGQKNTLQSTINTLTVQQKQLASKIQVTQSNIAFANKEIDRLSLSIGDKEESIRNNQEAIGSALRDIAENDHSTLFADLIASQDISEAWKAADTAIQFNRALGQHIDSLRDAKVVLADNRDKVSAEKAKLLALQKQLALEKRSVDASKAAQSQLLAQTKNQEANYQALIAQKKAAEQAFNQQLVALQDQLNLIVNPGLLPKVGSGVLRWPFTPAFMQGCAARKAFFGNLHCITQYFGNTAFSTANPQIYNGNGHNAIDIAAPIGTPVVAALSGTVLDTGNTDLARGCYSFGKWIMVKHANGLNTLYSHLSAIDVAKGQQVATGQVIGLSGMTGFATGPHIHFGVYASEGTKIMTLRAFRGATSGCADAKMPVATLTAYLNPLSYL